MELNLGPHPAPGLPACSFLSVWATGPGLLAGGEFSGQLHIGVPIAPHVKLCEQTDPPGGEKSQGLCCVTSGVVL